MWFGSEVCSGKAMESAMEPPEMVIPFCPFTTLHRIRSTSIEPARWGHLYPCSSGTSQDRVQQRDSSSPCEPAHPNLWLNLFLLSHHCPWSSVPIFEMRAANIKVTLKTRSSGIILPGQSYCTAYKHRLCVCFWRVWASADGLWFCCSQRWPQTLIFLLLPLPSSRVTDLWCHTQLIYKLYCPKVHLFFKPLFLYLKKNEEKTTTYLPRMFQELNV